MLYYYYWHNDPHKNIEIKCKNMLFVEGCHKNIPSIPTNTVVRADQSETFFMQTCFNKSCDADYNYSCTRRESW